MPLDPYIKTAATMPNYARAAGILVERCMARFGFEQPARPPRSRPSGWDGEPSEFPLHIRRYGIADEAAAVVHGYKPPPDDVPAGPDASNRYPGAPAAEPPPEYFAVLDGHGPGMTSPGVAVEIRSHPPTSSARSRRA